MTRLYHFLLSLASATPISINVIKLLDNIGERRKILIQINVEKLLKEQGKTKSWLCDQMDVSFYNLNKAIKGGKKSISYKYIERFL